MPVSVKTKPRQAAAVVAPQYSNTYTSWYNNAVTGSGFHSYRYPSFDIGAMRGTDILGFRKLKRSGALLPETSFVKYLAKGTLEPCVYAVRTNTPTPSDLVISNYGTSGAGAPFSTTEIRYGEAVPLWCISEQQLIDLVDFDEAHYWRQRAATKLYSSGHDTLTFLAELTKVRRMFLERAKRLVNYKNKYTEYRPSNEPGNWLEARYGWRTLVYDLQDLNKAIANFDQRMTRISERVGGRTSWSDSSVSSYTHAAVAGVVTRSWTTTVQYRGHITADFQPASFRLNPITTAWELLPFSFIIDWFVGVGQSLEAMSFLALSNDYASSFGVRVDVTENYVGTVVPIAPTYSTSPKGSHSSSWAANAEYSLVIRQPGPVSPIPQTKLRLDAFKVIDLLAIIYQKFRH